MKKKQSANNQSQDGKVSLLSPKKTLNNNVSLTIGSGANNSSNNNNNNRKGNISPTRLKSIK